MFGYTPNAARAYASVGLQSGAMSASPHKLISMLFEGAMVAILKARQHMAAGNVIEKGVAINHAVSIIDSGLRDCLNIQDGGEIAQNLSALYSYMTQRLSVAHLENDPQKLQEVYKLLADLKTTWDAIAPQAAKRTAALEV
jgi:flagellar protein FliS